MIFARSMNGYLCVFVCVCVYSVPHLRAEQKMG